MTYPYQDTGPLSEASLETVAAIRGTKAVENLDGQSRLLLMLISVLSNLATNVAALAGNGTAPEFTTDPSITGTAQEDEELTGDDGEFDSGTVVKREWLADAVVITGADQPTYTLTGAEVDAVITYRVTVRNATGPTSATSDATAAVIAA
jgi:hypothetical protein